LELQGYNPYALQKAFLEKHTGLLELRSRTGNARLLLAPSMQGRVMTSAADPEIGPGFGWINHAFISEGKSSIQFNNFGGEERIWVGPEGGPFSVFFSPGARQDYENWVVPAAVDREGFECVEVRKDSAVMRNRTKIVNAAGFEFDLELGRKVWFPEENELNELAGMNIPRKPGYVAYRSDNSITNTGKRQWRKDTGLLSVWMSTMLPVSPSTVIFLPFNERGDGPVVNDRYFVRVPGERLKSDRGLVWFRADGKLRSKIGMTAGRSTGLCGCYDAGSGVLTVLKILSAWKDGLFVNSAWGDQDDPYKGDMLNAYNDGPLDDGSQMGPFCELESSSPAAELRPGETLTLSQLIMHFRGSEEEFNRITQGLFGVSAGEIKQIFKDQ